ncbi:helix-turn-helix transcriptional regulator, partial [Candidatus Accumulibacter vicinus]|uniref:helix-turn-helix domain-containing protein n=1 Tax=Candidatus Accumulibacter vicinus TaxID=2954382 RepID=UPI00235B610E
MNFKAESGRRLRQAREAKRWTLNELAAQVQGVSASRISNYEQGIRLMRQPEAVKLAGALGVSAAHLMCVDESVMLPMKVQRLIYFYEQSDPRGQ